jgi:hypothetical protein
VTIELRRSALHGRIVDQDALDDMPRDQALAAMEQNNKTANDKVLARVEQALDGGRAHVTLTAPPDAGDYMVKVLVSSDATVAAGHAELKVGK